MITPWVALTLRPRRVAIRRREEVRTTIIRRVAVVSRHTAAATGKTTVPHPSRKTSTHETTTILITAPKGTEPTPITTPTPTRNITAADTPGPQAQTTPTPNSTRTPALTTRSTLHSSPRGTSTTASTKARTATTTTSGPAQNAVPSAAQTCASGTGPCAP